MAKWRKVSSLGIPLYDVTVKSGDRLFAPSWSLLSKYKKGLITEEVYTELFLTEMRLSYKNNKQHWIDFCKHTDVCIACYCKSGCFCHRYLLVDMFDKVCNNVDIDFEYKGEIK